MHGAAADGHFRPCRTARSANFGPSPFGGCARLPDVGYEGQEMGAALHAHPALATIGIPRFCVIVSTSSVGPTGQQGPGGAIIRSAYNRTSTERTSRNLPSWRSTWETRRRTDRRGDPSRAPPLVYYLHPAGMPSRWHRPRSRRDGHRQECFLQSEPIEHAALNAINDVSPPIQNSSGSARGCSTGSSRLRAPCMSQWENDGVMTFRTLRVRGFRSRQSPGGLEQQVALGVAALACV